MKNGYFNFDLVILNVDAHLTGKYFAVVRGDIL
jgi:hypothetical protein